MRWHGKWYGYDGGRKQQEETIQISFLYPLDLTYTHITRTRTHTDLYSHILLLLLYFFINEFNNPTDHTTIIIKYIRVHHAIHMLNSNIWQSEKGKRDVSKPAVRT